MKTCKKLFTLALALILLMSVLVLPAMAEAETSHVHTDTIQPRVPAVVCPYCGGNAIRYWPMQLLWWTDGFSRDD